MVHFKGHEYQQALREQRDPVMRDARARRQFWRELVLTLLVMLAALAMFLAMPAEGSPPGDADRLAAAMLAWQPTRARDADEIREYAGVFVAACEAARSPLPTREECPSLLAAIAFRESSWRETARGSRGEVGLMQLHGLALGALRRHPERAEDPATNVRLGVAWLTYAQHVCRRSKTRSDHAERALSAYGGLGCEPSAGARRALRWAAEIRAKER